MASPRPKGNTRTNQSAEFTAVDNVLETRETYDRNEKRDTAQNAATVAPDGDMDITDPEQRQGRTLTSDQLTAKLQAINSSFVIRVSKSNAARCNIYLPQWTRTVAGGWAKELVAITSFENTTVTGKPMAEFSSVTPTIESVPTADGDKKRMTFGMEVRGWRTVVATLAVKRVITSGDIDKHFGAIPTMDSQRWHSLMNNPLEVI